MNLTKKLATGLAIAGLLSFTVTGCGSNADKPAAKEMPTVKIMVGGMSKVIYLPAKLTESLGYFKEEGLNVELSDEAAGQSAEDALIAGEVDGVVGFYDHTIDLQSKGKSLESVVQLNGSPGEMLLVSNRLKDQVKSISDLKGKRIGVTGLGSSTNFLANYLVTKGGHTSQDYTPIPVGAGATLIAAMEQNRIDLAVTTQPTISLLEKKNLASPLVDMQGADATTSALGGTYPAACLYMQTSYVKEHPEVVQHLANAFVKTLRYIHTHTPEEIAAKMPPEYYAGDKDMYIKALTESMQMFTPDGKMPAGGPETVFQVLSTFDPALKNANIKLNQTYTTEFVDRVQ